MSLFEELRTIAVRHARGLGTESPVPGLRFHRTEADKKTSDQFIYQPMLCVVLQGEKRVALGSTLFNVAAGQYLIATVDLPVSGSLINREQGEPCIALGLKLNAELLAEILIMPPSMRVPETPSCGLVVGTLNSELLDALVRLTKLQDEPSSVAYLSPLFTREIIFRLLQSPAASMLRQFAAADSSASGVARAIRAMRDNYTEMFPRRLARTAGMSIASFNRHFRAVTAMSPLQYQKRIRLAEARRRLVLHQDNAVKVGFDIGYNSSSQFSREYSREFGRPPREDGRWLQSQAAPHAYTKTVSQPKKSISA